MIEKRQVERRIVNHQLCAADVIEELLRDFTKLRLVREKFAGDAMNFQRAFFAVALRVDVAMKMFACRLPVDNFHAANFDDAIAQCGVKAGGFGVENDLAHIKLLL